MWRRPARPGDPWVGSSLATSSHTSFHVWAMGVLADRRAHRAGFHRVQRGRDPRGAGNLVYQAITQHRAWFTTPPWSTLLAGLRLSLLVAAFYLMSSGIEKMLEPDTDQRLLMDSRRSWALRIAHPCGGSGRKQRRGRRRRRPCGDARPRRLTRWTPSLVVYPPTGPPLGSPPTGPRRAAETWPHADARRSRPLVRAATIAGGAQAYRARDELSRLVVADTAERPMR